MSNLNAAPSASEIDFVNAVFAPADALREPVSTHSEERLPFTIRVVQNEEDLRKAVLVRHAAYDRHVPEFASTLQLPEAVDHEQGVAVLLAESKLDRQSLGTMRIQTNLVKPLSLEHSLALPDWLQGKRLAEATRLGVSDGRSGRVVKTALFKAYYQYCVEAGIDWMIITARSPIDRQYDRLLFEDVYPGMGYIPLRHVGNMPHRVMALNVPGAKAKWIAAKHPLYNYVIETRHPDITTKVAAVKKPIYFRQETLPEREAMVA